ncbi:ArsR/SmtB family transcription factor [Virgibacillus oceani]
MEKLNGNFYVDRSPVYELFILMLRLADYKDSEKDTYQTRENEKMNEWIAEKQKGLPEHIVDKLNVFFHPDSFFGLAMTQVFYQLDKYDNIEESLKLLKSLDAKKMISLFFNTGQNTLDNESIIDNPSEVHDHVKNSTLPLNEKSKLFFLYFDPEDTMERFVNLIQYCYEQLYKPNAAELEKIHMEGIQTIKKLSVQQLSEIISFDSDSPEKFPETVIIFPSYYNRNHSIFSYDVKADIAISIAGMQLFEDLLDGANMEEKVIELARALSDKKRINIIRELNKAPHYGFELAQRLDLSSPTISHHMNVLFRLGLVTHTKYENKIYYEVNKDKLKKGLAEITDLLT